ncbi:MAG: site-specific integrase [Acidobacteriota bacterium]
MASQQAYASSETAEMRDVVGVRALYGGAGEFAIHIVRETGLPDVALTVFANELRRTLSESSVRGYVREIVAFVNWCASDPVTKARAWQWQAEPSQVRHAVRQYLTVAAECRITIRPDTLGVKASYVNVTAGTRINVGLLLAALKKLYDVLHDHGLYPFANPMVHEAARQTMGELRRQRREAMRASIGRAPMPAISGVDAPPTDLRLSENYFRLVRTQWQPQSIDDPDFPRAVYAAGQAYGWSLREQCITRMLFESGARVSEVMALTAGDWAVSQFLNRFRACNKGSHGRRIKTIVVSHQTATLCRRYVDDAQHGRCAADPERLTLRELTSLARRAPTQLEHVRLYLTARGTPMTAKLFRDHYWTPALRASGLDADPHLARHWFVTNALRHLERGAREEAELTRRKQELIEYMAWRSGEQTLRAYEHVERSERFQRRLHVIHQTMRRRERVTGHQAASAPAASGDLAGAAGSVRGDLAYLLGEDDDDR